MTIPKINIDDFEYWCLIHKKIPNIMNAPFDIWLSCINEYCKIYYKR